ncbi:MAG: hypothetical protein ACRDVM_02175 [Acidimicrobiia bacterium]
MSEIGAFFDGARRRLSTVVAGAGTWWDEARRDVAAEWGVFRRRAGPWWDGMRRGVAAGWGAFRSRVGLWWDGMRRGVAAGWGGVRRRARRPQAATASLGGGAGSRRAPRLSRHRPPARPSLVPVGVAAGLLLLLLAISVTRVITGFSEQVEALPSGPVSAGDL